MTQINDVEIVGVDEPKLAATLKAAGLSDDGEAGRTSTCRC